MWRLWKTSSTALKLARRCACWCSPWTSLASFDPRLEILIRETISLLVTSAWLMVLSWRMRISLLATLRWRSHKQRHFLLFFKRFSRIKTSFRKSVFVVQCMGVEGGTWPIKRRPWRVAVVGGMGARGLRTGSLFLHKAKFPSLKGH